MRPARRRNSSRPALSFCAMSLPERYDNINPAVASPQYASRSRAPGLAAKSQDEHEDHEGLKGMKKGRARPDAVDLTARLRRARLAPCPARQLSDDLLHALHFLHVLHA